MSTNSLPTSLKTAARMRAPSLVSTLPVWRRPCLRIRPCAAVGRNTPRMSRRTRYPAGPVTPAGPVAPPGPLQSTGTLCRPAVGNETVGKQQVDGHGQLVAHAVHVAPPVHPSHQRRVPDVADDAGALGMVGGLGLADGPDDDAVHHRSHL